MIEERNKEKTISEDELLLKMEKSGVSKEALQTIEYMNIVGDNVAGWLIRQQYGDEAIIKY